MNLLSRRGMSLLETLIISIPGFIISGTIIYGIGYVAYHFIMKFW